MKKTLFTAILAVACGAVASALEADLTPTGEGATANSNNTAMTADTVYSYTVGEWNGTWENSSLVNQAGFENGKVKLQIGAVAGGVGNFAGLHFELSKFATDPATLTFTMTKSSSWGGQINNFDCTYTCTVYGFDSTGAASELGSWSLAKAEEITEAQNVSIALKTADSKNFTSFGIIFNSNETTSLGSGAGVAMDITNLKVTYEPRYLTETSVVNACYDAADNRVTFQVADDLTDHAAAGAQLPLNVQVSEEVLAALITDLGIDAYTGVHFSLTDGALPSTGVLALSAGDPHTINLDTYEGTVTFNGSYVGEGSTGNRTYKLAYVPEPATATLSLLALAGLAARRRRK